MRFNSITVINGRMVWEEQIYLRSFVKKTAEKTLMRLGASN